jgi:hypothetical protein
LNFKKRVKSLATDISSNSLRQAQSAKIIPAKLLEYERKLKVYNPKIALTSILLRLNKKSTSKLSSCRKWDF